MKQQKASSLVTSDHLWDAWCILSVIGIWPRYIEPNTLSITHLKLPIRNLPPALEGFKIVQFSDLHLNPSVSQFFYNKLIKTIQSLSPDLIALTGDLLCYGEMRDPDRLHHLLCKLSAPYGCYAVLGNHDYAQAVSVNALSGDYDLVVNKSSAIGKGFRRLFAKTTLTKRTTPQALAVPYNIPLLDMLKNTPFELLDNRTKLIPIGNAFLNICGLGEYSIGRCLPAQAYAHYDQRYPGLTLLHNPDGALLLDPYPGNIILSGHSHGGQINLPWVWKKFTLLENPHFKQGLKSLGNKWLYISRGVGSVMPFRWFSPPEIVSITLEAVP